MARSKESLSLQWIDFFRPQKQIIMIGEWKKEDKHTLTPKINELQVWNKVTVHSFSFVFIKLNFLIWMWKKNCVCAHVVISVDDNGTSIHRCAHSLPWAREFVHFNSNNNDDTTKMVNEFYDLYALDKCKVL